MKPTTTLLNPNQATTSRNGTLVPNPQEQEPSQAQAEAPQPPAEAAEQQRQADSTAWIEFLTQGPVNISRSETAQTVVQEAQAEGADQEKIAAVLETLRVVSEQPVSPGVVEQPATVAEAERIIAEYQTEAVVEQPVEPISVQHLKGSGLIAQVKEGAADLIKHINFKVFFSDLKEAWGDLWNQISGKKEKPQPQVDPEEQEKIQNQQFQQQVNAQAERAHQTAKLNEIFKTTVVHQVEDLTAAQRAQLGGYHETSIDKDTAYGIAWTANTKKDREQQAQQPQSLPETGHKEQPGLFKPTKAQMTSAEHGEGSSRTTGRNTTG